MRNEERKMKAGEEVKTIKGKKQHILILNETFFESHSMVLTTTYDTGEDQLSNWLLGRLERKYNTRLSSIK